MADHTSLTPETVTLLAGIASARYAHACAVCGAVPDPGTSIVTTLGDVEVRAVGVTVHAVCAETVGRSGLLALMVAAYRAHSGI